MLKACPHPRITSGRKVRHFSFFISCFGWISFSTQSTVVTWSSSGTEMLSWQCPALREQKEACSAEPVPDTENKTGVPHVVVPIPSFLLWLCLCTHSQLRVVLPGVLKSTWPCGVWKEVLTFKNPTLCSQQYILYIW